MQRDNPCTANDWQLKNEAGALENAMANGMKPYQVLAGTCLLWSLPRRTCRISKYKCGLNRKLFAINVINAGTIKSMTTP